ncbi:Bifunctional inhibitor/lipid-transfer protein/seed storage 2S albumin superfamily protein [Melia azedarach]|uniref:Bifunctional inhibitor/lipid-transfer protein/seed storage 2S albumin superfamily protein n=1 Tax=Melia azedarach TaxID=155640 RepID=A0ACC1YLG8_MELAZ|nr:Bifunctional inhibitor/lipid-transfer protein/seed storage 2S albumin superfamily protein [Melia azedarach]
MDSARVYIMGSAIFIICAGLCLSSSQVSEQSCGVDISDLTYECLKYVQKEGPEDPPSQGCCAVVKTVDVPCACKLLTKDVVEIISDMISTKKAVFVARSCGMQLSPGTQCGSFTIPPA